MTWAIYAAETLTGRVGPRLPVVSGTWEDLVNDASSLRVTVDTPELLASVERWMWSPWSGALLACYDNEPIAFGPITKEPGGDPIHTELEAGGLWSLLDYRVTTDRDYTDGAALARSALTLDEGSLGTIARRIVERAMDRPAGWFPVSFASPEELGTAHTRTYKGFNIGNNSAGNRLRQITEVLNGPDIAFRPRWAERDHRVEWAMHHGTKAMPYISQHHYYVFDLTAPRSRVVTARVTADRTPVGRAYGAGAGEDEGTLIRIHTGPTRQYLPLLETTFADSQIENADLLDAKTRGLLDFGRLVQITAEIDDPSIPLHTLWAGDEVQVIFPSGWPQLNAGTYRMRVLSRSGNFESSRVRVEFQTLEVS